MQDFWDINKIKQFLPKDYPFLSIDRVIEADSEAKKIKCLKNITVNEYFSSSHFPAKAVIPTTIVVEAAFQSSMILYALVYPDTQSKVEYCLDQVEAKFFSKIKPGDQLVLEAKAGKISAKAAQVEVKALVSEDKVAQVTISLKIEPK